MKRRQLAGRLCRTALVAIAMVGLPLMASAQDATVTYLDGQVDVRTEGGSTFEADFGTGVNSGDRVVTGRTGTADLRLATGGTVNVRPRTVFLVGSAATPAGSTGRVAAAVGSFSFRFTAVAGNEPRIGSTTSVAGVRGTEVNVYVASDGTTRFEVVEGKVEIEKAGQTITLGPDQAVEIAPGRAPSAVFSFLQRPIDYSVWNGGLVANFLADPIPTLRGIAAEMDDLLAEIERRLPEVDRLRAEVDELNARLDRMREGDDRAAQARFFENTVMPARLASREVYVAFRFVVLSALSLDQYVVSRLGAELEAAYFLNPTDPTAVAVRRELAGIRSRFESIVTPRLVPSDF